MIPMSNVKGARGTAYPIFSSVIVALVLVSGGEALGQPDLVQVTADFSQDPGWEGRNNRVEASNPPRVTQDFGWRAGQIGGIVWQSTTPAWYGKPLDPPLSLKDKFSASGKITIQPNERNGVAYLGFFNHERQGWRPWNSMAMRIVSEGDKAFLYVDYMTALWNAGAAEMELEIPCDGSEHTWRIEYDPDATRAPWTDTKLHGYLNKERQQITELLAKAHAAGEPDLTPDALRERLKAALAQGLINYLPRHNTEYWLLKQEDEDLKGVVSVQVDDSPPFRTYLSAAMRGQPVELDRFGIFNFQMYHGVIDFRVWDLAVNNKKIDLSTDPDWEGQGNVAQFFEHDFQRQDFGYSSDTNHAGGSRGEIGGQFYNVEPIDPHHGYYADDIGELTLDDPIHFSGKISFIELSTDAGLFFGFFRAADEQRELPANQPNGQATGWPQPNVLGVVVDGPASVGCYFTPVCTSADPRLSKDRSGHIFLPTRTHRTFVFDYDPKANDGVGRVTVKLDGEAPFTLDLTPEQRQSGATLDRFGLMSFRRGGKFSKIYFDDLTYTARRPEGYEPVRHKQQTVTVPYPQGGRKY